MKGEQTVEHKCNKSDIKAIEKCELNPKQIIKALEEKLENYRDCEAQFKIKLDITEVIANTLSLINELTEENKAWQKELVDTKEQANKAYYELACEVEDLRAIAEQYQKQFEEAKADTVREMQEMLKYTLCINNEENTEFFDYVYTLETIDQIAKEMVEGIE
jgi:hypothetical protein